MAAAYIDATYLGAYLSSSQLSALFSDDDVSNTKRTQVIQSASAIIQSALQNAGYTVGDTTTDELVKLATFGQFLILSYGARKGLTIPQQLSDAINVRDALVSGQLKPPTLTPNSSTAVGGVTAPDTSGDTAVEDGGMPQIFSRKNMVVF